MKLMKLMCRRTLPVLLCAICLSACVQTEKRTKEAVPEAQFTLTSEQTHNKFSASIPPALTVPSGAVIQVETKEASDGQLALDSSIDALKALDFEPIHPLTGPVFVEGAQPGDVLAVSLLKIEAGEWGWAAIVPGFGFLADEFTTPVLKTFKLESGARTIKFSDKISIPLNPFPGVMGVAPATDSLLNTIPPRANGGNMDNPFHTVGTTIYFPVFVEGGLFSVGDTHAAQGLGEISGTAIEAPMKITYKIEVIKNKKMAEPQYENKDYYAVTAYATTIDEAAKKASQYMIQYLVENHGLSREDAYILCSLAGNLHIAEVVDVPHVLVTMHISKSVLGEQ